VIGRTGWEIDWRQGTDIDTEDDWEMAETLIAMTRGKMCAKVGEIE
jgi:hypothetical protein